jgi:hypothetical protein
MYSVRKTPTSNRVNRVTGLMRAPVNLKPLSAILKHLWHEWEALQAASFVERPQDLFFASDLHPVSRPNFHKRPRDV